MDDAGLRPRTPTDRWLASLAHAAGVLGVTILGWAVAAALSGLLLWQAGRRRSRYLAAHAGQAAVYQLVVLAIDVLALSWLVTGFIYFLADIPGLPRLRPGYASEAVAMALSVVWALTVLLLPVWHLATVVYAIIAARRTAGDRPFWYAVIGRRVRQLAAASSAGRAAAGHG